MNGTSLATKTILHSEPDMLKEGDTLGSARNTKIQNVSSKNIGNFLKPKISLNSA